MMRHHRLLSSLCLLVGILWAGTALAVGNVNVETAGANAQQATLVLTTEKGEEVKQDDDSDRVAGLWWWRNRIAGYYLLRVLVAGQLVGTPQRVEVRDGETTRYRVDTVTGVATLIAAARFVRVQQQQRMFWLGAMAGYASSNVDSTLSSPFGAGSSGLDSDGFTGGVELTLTPFARRAFAIGEPFFFAGALWNNTSATSTFLNLHPTPGLDSGTSADIRYSLRGGAGLRWALRQDLALAFMAGMAYSSVRSSIFTNESGGGGTYNQFSQTRGMWGPLVGLELAYAMAMFPAVSTEMFIRAERTWMGNTDLSGRSTLGFPYTGSVDAQATNRFMLGLRFALK